MGHKCDGCRYKGEHQEMMFRPFGVCTKELNLADAEKNYNAEKCPYDNTAVCAEAFNGMSSVATTAKKAAVAMDELSNNIETYQQTIERIRSNYYDGN